MSQTCPSFRGQFEGQEHEEGQDHSSEAWVNAAVVHVEPRQPYHLRQNAAKNVATPTL